MCRKVLFLLLNQNKQLPAFLGNLFLDIIIRKRKRNKGKGVEDGDKRRTSIIVNNNPRIPPKY